MQSGARRQAGGGGTLAANARDAPESLLRWSEDERRVPLVLEEVVMALSVTDPL